MKGYSNKDAAEALQMSSYTISYYTGSGLVTPDIDNPQGKGKTRIYSKRNLVQLWVIKRLVGCGGSLRNAKALLSMLDELANRNGFHLLDPACLQTKCLDILLCVSIDTHNVQRYDVFFQKMNVPGDFRNDVDYVAVLNVRQIMDRIGDL